jgi:hypothetical protein
LTLGRRKKKRRGRRWKRKKRELCLSSEATSALGFYILSLGPHLLRGRRKVIILTV